MKDLKFILSYGDNTLELTHAPDGWDDALVKYDRSTKYWGLFRSYSISLRFLKEGAELLRNAFYSQGITSDVTLQIQKLNRLTMAYYTAYTAKVDFITFKDSTEFVDVMVVDGGLSALIKANENTVYEIDITAGIPIEIEYTPGYNKYIPGADFTDVFSAIIDKVTDGKITDDTYDVSSNFLENLEGFVVLASTNVMPAYVSNPHFIIKTSLSDFFKSIHAAYCLGMGIEVIAGKETLIIDELSYFFDSATEIASFDDVNDFELSVDQSFLFNTVKVGWPEATYSNQDMINEPNTTSRFGVPGLNINKELDLVSKYRADYTGLLDILNSSEPQKEYEYFILSVEFQEYGNVYVMPTPGRLQKSYDLGVYYDLYNPYLTPIRLLSAHEDYINSCLYIQADVEFISAGNENSANKTEVSTGAGFLDEYGYLSIGIPAIFMPYVFKIEVPLLQDFNALLGIESTGYINFTYQDVEYKGYIMSASVKLAGRGVVEMKLLASYDNDFTNLIR